MSGAESVIGRLAGVTRGRELEVFVDGEATPAFEGESVAAVLLASGPRPFRMTAGLGQPRSYYCGMGICFECLVTVDGRRNVRACMTRLEDGMKIETGTR